MDYILIDIGSSFIKGALFDAERVLLRGITTVPTPPFLDPTHPFKRENDIEKILQSVTGLLSQLGGKVKADGIFFSTQMHGFVLTDPAGKPLSPFVSWQDTRSLQINPATGKSFLSDHLNSISESCRQKTGGPSHAGPSAYTLYAMRQRGEYDGRGRFFTLGDYMLFRLSGGRCGCHLTQAAATGLVNLETENWNREIIDATGLDATVFPEIFSETEAIGAVELNQGKVPIYPALGDQQAAIAGALAQEGTDLIINIGTGSQVGRIETGLEYGSYELRPYFGGKHLRTVTRLPGGSALNVLINFVAEVIAKVGGNTKVNVSEIWTTLNGLGATETNLKSNLSFSAKDGEGAGGSISNITDSNLSPGNLLKSAYDNMAENYFQYGTALGGDIGRVLCMGGISARCAPLRQSISKRFGLEVHTAPFGEDTLCGLARVALRVSGRCRDFAQTAALLEKLVIEPKTEG